MGHDATRSSRRGRLRRAALSVKRRTAFHGSIVDRLEFVMGNSAGLLDSEYPMGEMGRGNSKLPADRSETPQRRLPFGQEDPAVAPDEIV